MAVIALISAALALWLAVWLSSPRLPAPHNETAWLVYSRMLGNRDRIQLLAICVSYAAFFAALIAVMSYA